MAAECPTCGLRDPGPEHRAHEPLLCAERRREPESSRLIADAYDIRVLVKPPTEREPQWIVNAQRQARERSSWESFAQAGGDSFAAALRAAADLMDNSGDA